MRPFTCANCGQLLFFENTACLSCGAELGYEPGDRRLLALAVDGSGELIRLDGSPGSYRRCANLNVARCNWLLVGEDHESLCTSCRLTSVRPNDDDVTGLAAFADAEAAKRRLLDSLSGLRLPITDRDLDPARGVAFEFLSSRNREVITGHDAGVITLDLSESDDAHREFVRNQLGEPYRTVIGHLRHEIGHYYWPLLVVDRGLLDAFRSLFGDETVSYDDAKAAHYAAPADGWVDTHVSQYATMHPWEDWAETFAHYLHIRDGLESADEFGLRVTEPALRAGRTAVADATTRPITPMIEAWLALTVALNGMARSIGQNDLYPFVLSDGVIEKLDFVHRAVTAATTS